MRERHECVRATVEERHSPPSAHFQTVRALLGSLATTMEDGGRAKRVTRKSPQEKLAILAFLEAGGAPEDAAARFGVARAAVLRLLREREDDGGSNSGSNGGNNNSNSGNSALGKRPRAPAGPEQVAAFAQQATVAAAAAKFGLPRAEVSRMLRETGASAEALALVAADAVGVGVAGDGALDAHMAALGAGEALDEELERVDEHRQAAVVHFIEQGGAPTAAADKFAVSLAVVARLIKDKADQLAAHGAALSASMASDVPMPDADADADAAASMSILDVPSAPANSTSSTDTDTSVDLAATGNGVAVAGIAPATPTAVSVSNVAPNDAVAAATVSSLTVGAPAPESVDAATGTAAAKTAQVVAPRKGRRVRKTNSEKLEILAFVEKGGSQGAAAEKFGVSRTAVTKMVKEKEAICAQARSENTNSRKVLQYQHKLSIIEDMLYKWQLQVEIDSPTTKLTGDLLQSKAMEFRNKVLADYSSELPDEVVLSLTDFKASNGWLHRYMQRRSIRALPKHNDDNADNGGDRAEQRVQRVRMVLAQVPASCIWTLSEIVLRHRTTSGRVDALINLEPRSMDRLSVAMAVSAAGEKLQLHVVGKSERATALLSGDGADAADPAAYGVLFRAHTRAWHDSYAVMEYIQLLNREAKARKQTWFLVLDSSASHVAAAHALHPSGSYRSGFTLESMVLLFLPPTATVDSTSFGTRDMQPLHQGIIRDLKRSYRAELIQSLVGARRTWAELKGNEGVAATPAATEFFDIHAHTTIRHSLSWLQKAWAAVSTEDIKQAWKSIPYLPAQLLDGDATMSMSTAMIGSLTAPTSGSVTTPGQLKALLAESANVAKDLGLEMFVDSKIHDEDALDAEVVDFDSSDSNGSDYLAKEDEIVIESLSLQGLLREPPRSIDDLSKEASIAAAGPEIASMGEACTTVARLLRFLTARTNTTVANSQELLTPSDRRAARANLLALQRVLIKARTKEQEQLQQQEHVHDHDAATAYTV